MTACEWMARVATEGFESMTTGRVPAKFVDDVSAGTTEAIRRRELRAARKNDCERRAEMEAIWQSRLLKAAP